VTRPTTISFSVEAPPPRKDAIKSIWNKDSELFNLRALRIAAAHAMAGRARFTERVELIFILYPNTSSADLDNLIGGICDGLQAGWCPHDGSRWLEVPEQARPDRSIAFTDDSIIVSILARRAESPDRQNGDEVTIVGN
jgi:hypothetical protein